MGGATSRDKRKWHPIALCRVSGQEVWCDGFSEGWRSAAETWDGVVMPEFDVGSRSGQRARGGGEHWRMTTPVLCGMRALAARGGEARLVGACQCHRGGAR